MSLQEEFSNITGELKSAIVERNISFPELRNSPEMQDLTDRFMTLAAKYKIVPSAEKQSPAFPTLRTAITQLDDAATLWKSYVQTRHYAQNTVNALNAFRA
jgi:hypothetical protein